MTAPTDFRAHIAALAELARAEGERDFADLLTSFRKALTAETRDKDECVDLAQAIRDDAERIADRFDQAADYLHGGWESYSAQVRA